MKKGIERILLAGIIAGSLGVSGCASGPNYSRVSVNGVKDVIGDNDLSKINYIVEGNSELTSANHDRLVRCLGDLNGNTYVNQTAYNQAIGKCVKGKANQDKFVNGGVAALVDAVKIGGSYFLLRGATGIRTGSSGGTGGIGSGGSKIIIKPGF